MGMENIYKGFDRQINFSTKYATCQPSDKSVVTHDHMALTVASSDDQFDNISSRLMPSTKTKPKRKIMFACSSNGESSTEIAIQYAHSLAIDSPYKILLMDVKLKNPNFVKLFNVDPTMEGLADLIKNNGNVKSFVKKVDPGNLYILPVGKNTSSTSNILKNFSFANFMDEAASEFDYVIIDAPPVLNSSVCRIIGPMVDGVIMVIEADKTRRQVALKAKQELEHSNSNILGAILNKRKFHIPIWLYNKI
ncbi:MAG: CpsD/CapB family tyrosine-protein kinase [Desulfobacteraceae bacterium]|nr:CpsD/CapB family tyrosine-protein kinase [Desulfobacteraceae bacterium]